MHLGCHLGTPSPLGRGCPDAVGRNPPNRKKSGGFRPTRRSACFLSLLALPAGRTYGFWRFSICSVKEKALPLPGVLSTLMVSPMAVSTSLAMERPRPEPVLPWDLSTL